MGIGAGKESDIQDRVQIFFYDDTMMSFEVDQDLANKIAFL